ncbi:Carboxylesterase YbfK [Paraconexibacter sp. AEG42_29]|uniref:Carboxylesterase YbfK n=1 Tax=Paraconexibacter sp. AEG42_29 TaxID=2997339 RepID=A0AAU7B344_9ACTN
MTDDDRPGSAVLAHDDVGTGPAVLLIHAGIADRRMWSDHTQALAQAGRRVIAVDLPGYGDSPAPASVDEPWEDVIAVLDGLGITRAAVVGVSFGGAVALRVAAAAPARVSALVVVSAPVDAVAPSPSLQAAWAAEEVALERGDVDAAVTAVVDAWTLPGAPAALRERVAAMQRRAFAVQLTAPDTGEAPDPLDEELGALAAISGLPILFAVGEHDRSDFHDGAALLAAAVPGSRLAVIPGAGHLAPLEAPGAFRDLLLDVLGRT